MYKTNKFTEEQYFSGRDAVMDVFAMLEEIVAIIKKMLDDFKAWIAIYFPQEEE